LASLKHIVEDPEASDNDKFVAYDFLKNANIAAGGVQARLLQILRHAARPRLGGRPRFP
jgi:hypothetical protein